ncbi:MAG: hypothetical protein ACRD2L_05335, partial [Terriglobia bacterium]
TKDAGETSIGDTAGWLINCLPLGNVNVLYKEDSVHAMRLIGGTKVFDFYAITEESGLLAQRALANFPGGQVFLAHNDIAMTDGRAPISLTDGRLRQWIENNLDKDNVSKSFAVHYRRKGKVLFCIPTTGVTFPNVAIEWDYSRNGFTVRDLSEIAHIAPAAFNPSATGDPWDPDSQAWDADSGLWDQKNFGLTGPDLWLAKPGADKKILRLDDTELEDGSLMTAYVERTGLSIIGRDRTGEPKADINSEKLVRGIRPRMKATGHVHVYLAEQMEIQRDAPVKWHGPFTFDPVNGQLEVNHVVTTRLVGYRIESDADIHWELDGLDIDVEVLGG